MRHSVIDIKKTSKNINPGNDYIRLKAGLDGKLQYITPTGEIFNISSPWELPVKNKTTIDPSILSPTIYDRFIVPDSAINAWSSHDNDIAIWDGFNWEFKTPRVNWVVLNEDDQMLYTFTSSNKWVALKLNVDNNTINFDNDGNLSIVGIDRVIGGDGLSLDITHVPMSNPGAELVTRDFVSNWSSRVDKMTIDKEVGKAPVSTTNVEVDFLRDGWDPNMFDFHINNDPLLDHGVLFVPPRTTILGNQVNPTYPSSDSRPVMPIGIYRLYASIDLTPYGFHIANRDDFYGGTLKEIYATSRYEDGLWLHEFNVDVSDFKFYIFELDTRNNPGFYMQLIIQGTYPATIREEIKSMGISRIINADGYGLDPFAMYMNNPETELATRNYIDKTKNNPDNITIEGNVNSNIVYSIENDINEIWLDSYGHESATDGFVLDSDWVLVDGVFTFTGDYNNSNSSTVLYRPSGDIHPTITTPFNFYMLSNVDWQPLIGYNTPSCATMDNLGLSYAEVTDLGNGEWLYRFHVPKGDDKKLRGFNISWSSAWPPPVRPYIKLVKYDEYPPNMVIKINEIDRIINSDGLSIDSEHVTMVNGDRELPTRSYVDSKNIKKYKTILSSTDISNKYVDIGDIISTLVDFKILGAGAQIINDDYDLDGSDIHRVTWSGLTLDGELIAGDEILILYI